MEERSVKRALILALAAALCAAPLAAADRPYKAPRNAFGQPDLSGVWTNVSLTDETRPRALGERLVYTEAEAARIEAAVAEEFATADQPLDPNLAAPKAGGEYLQSRNPIFTAAGGAVGGYNHGWLES